MNIKYIENYYVCLIYWTYMIYKYINGKFLLVDKITYKVIMVRRVVIECYNNQKGYLYMWVGTNICDLWVKIYNVVRSNTHISTYNKVKKWFGRVEIDSDVCSRMH